MANESPRLTPKQYNLFVTLPSVIGGFVLALLAADNILLEASTDAIEGDWRSAGGNVLEGLFYAGIASAVGKSAADAAKTRIDN